MTTVLLSSHLCFQVSERPQSRERARQDEKMKEGLRAALEEINTIQLHLQVTACPATTVRQTTMMGPQYVCASAAQESHSEGELLRCALEDKKESERIREDVLQDGERGEGKELRARVKALERMRREMMEELQDVKEKAVTEEGERRQMEEETMKLKAQVKTLKEKEEAWRSRLEVRDKEVEESRAELSRVRATVAMMEEQISSVLQGSEEIRRLLSQREEEVKTLNSVTCFKCVSTQKDVDVDPT